MQPEAEALRREVEVLRREVAALLGRRLEERGPGGGPAPPLLLPRVDTLQDAVQLVSRLRELNLLMRDRLGASLRAELEGARAAVCARLEALTQGLARMQRDVLRADAVEEALDSQIAALNRYALKFRREYAREASDKALMFHFLARERELFQRRYGVYTAALAGAVRAQSRAEAAASGSRRALEEERRRTSFAAEECEVLLARNAELERRAREAAAAERAAAREREARDGEAAEETRRRLLEASAQAAEELARAAADAGECLGAAARTLGELSVSVSGLREEVGEGLRRAAGGYVLAAAPIWPGLGVGEGWGGAPAGGTRGGDPGSPGDRREEAGREGDGAGAGDRVYAGADSPVCDRGEGADPSGRPSDAPGAPRVSGVSGAQEGQTATPAIPASPAAPLAPPAPSGVPRPRGLSAYLLAGTEDLQAENDFLRAQLSAARSELARARTDLARERRRREGAQAAEREALEARACKLELLVDYVRHEVESLLGPAAPHPPDGRGAAAGAVEPAVPISAQDARRLLRIVRLSAADVPRAIEARLAPPAPPPGPAARGSPVFPGTRDPAPGTPSSPSSQEPQQGEPPQKRAPDPPAGTP